MPPSPPPQKTPWASVVRGGDTENISPTAAEVEGGLGHEAQNEESSVSIQAQDEASSGGSKKPVWNRPNNVVEAGGGSVMGGSVAWPALSESARTGGGSRPVVADGSYTQAPPILPQPPLQPANNNGTHGSSTASNSSANNRQRSRNRGGGGGGGGVNPPSAPPPPPPPPPSFPIYERPYFMRSPQTASQSQMGSEQHSPSRRNNPRRGSNYNPRPRGDGSSFHNNHGNRRDQDRRGFQAPLPLYMHPPPPPPVGYMPPPPPPLPLGGAGATPFMMPQQMRPFPGLFGVEIPQGYLLPSMPSDPYRPAMPPQSPPPPPPPQMLYSPVNESSLATLILNQVNFYFSDYNLAGDEFLRSNMDDHGWVPISLIASFRRVQILTNDIQVILDALRDSPLLEIEGDKVRRRNNWSKWLPSSSNPVSSPASEAALSTPMQNMSLDHNESRLANGGDDDSEADDERKTTP